VLSVRKETGGRQANVLVHRLYPAVAALDKELGVQEALDAEHNTVLATETDGDSAQCELG
jgi:hypothetical protein